MRRSHELVVYTPPGYGSRLAIPFRFPAQPASELPRSDSPPPSYESVIGATSLDQQPPSQFILPPSEHENFRMLLPEYNALYNGQTNGSTPTAPEWNGPDTDYNMSPPPQTIPMTPTAPHWSTLALDTGHPNSLASPTATGTPGAAQWNIPRGLPDYNDLIPSPPVNTRNRVTFQESEETINPSPADYSKISIVLGRLLIFISLVQVMSAIMLMTSGNYHSLRSLSYGIPFIGFIFFIFSALLLLSAWIRPCASKSNTVISFGAITFIVSVIGLVFNFVDFAVLHSCYNRYTYFWSYQNCEYNSWHTQLLFIIITGINGLVLLMSLLVCFCRKSM